MGLAMPVRRLLRWAWCLFALGVLGVLPWLIIQFKRHDWGGPDAGLVHRWPGRYRHPARHRL